MQSTYFEDEYPVKWASTDIYQFSELENEPGALTNQLQVTYSSPKQDGSLGQNAQDFARQVTTFNLMWRRQSLMYMGFNQDIEASRIFAIY